MHVLSVLSAFCQHNKSELGASTAVHIYMADYRLPDLGKNILLSQVNSRNTSAISCDNKRNGINCQRRQDSGNGSIMKGHSINQIDQLSNGGERKRGIRHDDSLSPLLFVSCMDPLSHKLNSRYPKMAVSTDQGMHPTNHLLFVDDLKLLATNENIMKAMAEEVRERR
ncbi:unnamed protein product [Thelazia callipaeda]|uniref:Reverse transcriptase domain-containing protein n=1 Tax=Thelazia callipaeda TaxID=103827 RepID=A0A0N5CV83_THECL|nr:unnamed protein product [Thelazia callipaeda]